MSNMVRGKTWEIEAASWADIDLEQNARLRQLLGERSPELALTDHWELVSIETVSVTHVGGEIRVVVRVYIRPTRMP